MRFSDGDRAAIQTLLDELWPVLLAFALRSLGNEHDAEDVAQEVFVRICSRASEFDRTRDGVAWVFGIAGYEVMTQRRRKQRRRETTDAELRRVADLGQLSEEALIHQDLIHSLVHVVGELTVDDRAMLGFSACPSDELALSGATLRKRKQRALNRLRTAWRRLHGGP